MLVKTKHTYFLQRRNKPQEDIIKILIVKIRDFLMLYSKR